MIDLFEFDERVKLSSRAEALLLLESVSLILTSVTLEKVSLSNLNKPEPGFPPVPELL